MRRPAAQAGSAITEFVMVGALVIALVVGVLQLALGLYVRNVLIDAAGEGARQGALVGAGPADAEERTRRLIAMSLHPQYADQVTATIIERDGMRLVRVQVSAPLPVIGLVGPTGTLQVDGHALVEPGAGP